MPTQFTIIIPKSSTDQTQLAREIKIRLTHKLANSKYRENFPFNVYVKEWNQGRIDRWLRKFFRNWGLIIDSMDGYNEAPIGNYYIYIKQADKIALQVGSQRSSQLAVKDMTTSKAE